MRKEHYFTSTIAAMLSIGSLGCGSASQPVTTAANPPSVTTTSEAAVAAATPAPKTETKTAEAAPATTPVSPAATESPVQQKPASAAVEPAKSPALAAEFVNVIDLRKMPRINETLLMEEGPTHVHYSAKTTIAGGDAFCSAELGSRGWKPAPGQPMITDQYSERLFEKNGFYLRLSMGAGADEGVAGIMLYSLGNIDLRSLPRIGSVAIGAGSTPVNVNYQTDASMADATKFCREQLSKLGWREFGPIDGPNIEVPHVKQLSFFQNATRLDVMVTRLVDKPAGPTYVAYMAQPGLGFDLPMMQDATSIKLDLYSGKAEYQSPSTPEQLFAFYQSTGKRLGWKPQEKGTHVQKDTASLIVEDQPERGFGIYISRNDDQSKISLTRLSMKKTAEVAEAEEPKATQVVTTELPAEPELPKTDPVEEAAAAILKDVQKSLQNDLGNLQKALKGGDLDGLQGELEKLTGKLPRSSDEEPEAEVKTEVTTEIEEEKPSAADLALPKLETAGEFSFDKAKHKLKHAVAYRVVEDNKATPVVVLSEEPINKKKLEELLASGKEVWLHDLFGFKMPASVQVRLQKDYTSVSAYVDGASINISSGDAFQTDFKVIGPRLRGTLHQREKGDFFDKAYQIDASFDVEMVNAKKK